MAALGSTADPDRRRRLVSTGEQGLPVQLAEQIDGHLATFADHVTSSQLRTCLESLGGGASHGFGVWWVMLGYGYLDWK